MNLQMLTVHEMYYIVSCPVKGLSPIRFINWYVQLNRQVVFVQLHVLGYIPEGFFRFPVYGCSFVLYYDLMFYIYIKKADVNVYNLSFNFEMLLCFPLCLLDL